MPGEPYGPPGIVYISGGAIYRIERILFMTKNIKTREYVIDIKTKDKAKNITHYIKQHTITRKTNI